MRNRDESSRSSDPRFPVPEQQPTQGPVEYWDGDVTGAPELPDHLGDPTRRKHPTILSQEGEEEAPESELPPRKGA
ncbi:MAG: hypothetical protein HY321_22370 [Armatimonadetes bacterium]|nr:hypothetical protein [Armatimonadota bacterium]